MNSEEIEKFLDGLDSTDNNYVKISFKKRNPVFGLFPKGKDYAELKAKNFWRIVTRPNFDEWNKSRDMNLAKLFSGSDFTRLSLHNDDTK